MKGLILADIKVIKMHDKNLESGASKLIPATITKAGDISEAKTSGVNKEEFEILQNYIYFCILIYVFHYFLHNFIIYCYTPLC